MKKFSTMIASGFVVSCGLTAAMTWAAPAQAQKYQYNQNKHNYVGPAVSFGSNTTAVGATSRFGIAETLSVRPFLAIGNGSSIFGGSVTYDFNLDTGEGQSNGFTPYAGAGIIGSSGLGSSGVYLEIGADYNASETIVLNANHRFNSGGFTSVGVGLKF
jgi:hypothetical protein